MSENSRHDRINRGYKPQKNNQDNRGGIKNE